MRFLDETIKRGNSLTLIYLCSIRMTHRPLATLKELDRVPIGIFPNRRRVRRTVLYKRPALCTQMGINRFLGKREFLLYFPWNSAVTTLEWRAALSIMRFSNFRRSEEHTSELQSP